MAARSATDRGADTRCLREIMLENLSTRFGKTSMDLLAAIEGDYGSVGRRRFHRQLAFLIEVGCARRDREWDLDTGHWRPIYFRLSSDIPKIHRGFFTKQSCPECGMANTTARTHPEHERAQRTIRERPTRASEPAARRSA